MASHDGPPETSSHSSVFIQLLFSPSFPALLAEISAPMRQEPLLSMRGDSQCLCCAVLQKLKDATPLTQPMRYVGIENVRRYYEHVRLPDRLCVLGDSAAAFNPVRAHSCHCLPRLC